MWTLTFICILVAVYGFVLSSPAGRSDTKNAPVSILNLEDAANLHHRVARSDSFLDKVKDAMEDVGEKVAKMGKTVKKEAKKAKDKIMGRRRRSTLNREEQAQDMVLNLQMLHNFK